MKIYLPQTWKDPRIEFRTSRISGNGMFAREPIKKGETVCVVGGTMMADAEFTDFQGTHLLYSFIQIDENLYLVEDLETAQFLYASMNHSCDSNAWMDDEVTLVARRDIEPEGEVTVDYALFTTQSNWMLDTRCRCGSPHCRRIITGDDWRREDVQERYGGHFSPFINRRIERLMKGRLHDI
ncbi:MAG TPA: SET domain-containing protein-lysine N-methyltransferase [Chitinophagaceae bacterium]|nr:SET domain-containing protein-lysine N-methyltransferase [Chitinophagaceae bacterium]